MSPVIQAIQEAVERDPGNVELRSHLIKLLLEAGFAAEALANAEQALRADPYNADVLSQAAQACEASGDPEGAARYAKLHGALAPAHEKNPSESATSRERGDVPPTSDSEPADKKVVPLTVIPGGMSRPEAWEEETAVVTLDDVAGMESVKRRLHLSFLGPLKNPDITKSLGKQLRGGLMLYGPPGCGKTFIARAAAGELGARFISVGLSEILDMYLGQSERNLHEIFENARRKSPCVLFIDEIDALGRKRSLRRESAGRDIVNQLLTELDSVQSNNKALFVLAATNHPWDVDTALRRPGRLDRLLLVLPPDSAARLEILTRNLSGRLTAELDLESLSRKTEDYSGADLVHLCESAAELAMEASLQADKAMPITDHHLSQALREVKPSVRPWFETARNYALFANEGGTYDDLIDYLRSKKMV